MLFNCNQWHYANMLQVRAEPVESVTKKFRRNTCNGNQRLFGGYLQHMSKCISWGMSLHFRGNFACSRLPLIAVAGVAPATQVHCTSMPGAHLQHLSKLIP